jgi:glycosyltransferase involved in cell wall biosynthesis
VNPRARALFVNSGILGHAAVAAMVRDAIARTSRIDARHIDASEPQTRGERIARAVACLSVAPSAGPLVNIDLCRWRAEMHTGWIARRRIARALSEHEADVIHFHTQPSAYASADIMERIPSVVSIDITQSLARTEIAGGVARATYAPNIWHDGRVFRRSRAIIATSRWAADDLIRRYPSFHDRVRVLPYASRVDRTDPMWIEERFGRAHDGPIRFLFIGGDFVRKGGWDLIEAWRTSGLARRAVLVIVTAFNLTRARLPEGVVLAAPVLPYSSEWLDLWRAADVFVLPTRAEAFGMVLQEAAAAGLPAVATKLNATPEIVDDGITGLLVTPGNTTALADAMRTLAASASLRRDMGRAARRRAERMWNIDAYGAALADVLETAAGRVVEAA